MKNGDAEDGSSVGGRVLREMSILTSGLGYLNHDALLERGRLGEVPPCANNVRAKDTAFSSRPAISLLLDSWRLNVLLDDAQAPKMTAAIPQAWCNLEEQLQPWYETLPWIWRLQRSHARPSVPG